MIDPNLLDSPRRINRQRHRNIATFAALMLFVVLIYAVTLVRMGGHG